MPSPEVARTAVESYASLLGEGKKEAWLDLFALDATVIDPVPTGSHEGREAIGGFYDGITKMADHVSVDVLNLHVCGDEVAMVYRLSLRAAAGGGMAFEGVGIFTVADDGLIRSVRAYWDPKAVFRLDPDAA